MPLLFICPNGGGGLQAEYGGFPAGSRALVPRSAAPGGTVEEVKEQASIYVVIDKVQSVYMMTVAMDITQRVCFSFVFFQALFVYCFSLSCL